MIFVMHKTIRIYTIIIFTIITSVELFGQPLIGAQLGLNLSKLSGDKGNDENTMRVGVSPYITLDFPINHMISIETGIAYSMQGMKRTQFDRETTYVSTTTTKYQLDYFVVPLYLKENFTNFYAKIGPYGAFLASGVEKWDRTENALGEITNTSGINSDFGSTISPYDVGLSIGFGHIHYFPKSRRRRRKSFGKRRTSRVLQVDFKYNFGFVPLNNTGNDPNLNLRNRVFSVGLSINSVID